MAKLKFAKQSQKHKTMKKKKPIWQNIRYVNIRIGVE